MVGNPALSDFNPVGICCVKANIGTEISCAASSASDNFAVITTSPFFGRSK